MKKTKVEKLYKAADVSLKKFNNINMLKSKYRNVFVEDIENNKDFALILSTFSAQVKGPKYQNRFAKLLNGQIVDSKLDRGDIKAKIDGKDSYIEVKTSTPSLDGNVLNLVQIRLYQNIDYYLCVFVDDINYQQNYVFLLTKEQMQQEIKKMNASNAHIAHHSISNNVNVEKRMTIDLNDLNNEHTKRWLKNYRSVELEQKLLGEQKQIMTNETKLVEAIKSELEEKATEAGLDLETYTQNQEYSREAFLELCKQYNVEPSEKLINKIEEATGIAVDYTALENEVSIIEKKISVLLKQYDSAQKHYHGDSSVSKQIEAEIENLECKLDKLNDRKSKAYKLAWNYLRKLARENNWKEYEICEDSYKYPDGLFLIAYSDKAHEEEIDHVCINAMDFDKTTKKSK